MVFVYIERPWEMTHFDLFGPKPIIFVKNWLPKNILDDLIYIRTESSSLQNSSQAIRNTAFRKLYQPHTDLQKLQNCCVKSFVVCVWRGKIDSARPTFQFVQSVFGFAVCVRVFKLH